QMVPTGREMGREQRGDWSEPDAMDATAVQEAWDRIVAREKELLECQQALDSLSPQQVQALLANLEGRLLRSMAPASAPSKRAPPSDMRPVVRAKPRRVASPLHPRSSLPPSAGRILSPQPG